MTWKFITSWNVKRTRFWGSFRCLCTIFSAKVLWEMFKMNEKLYFQENKTFFVENICMQFGKRHGNVWQSECNSFYFLNMLLSTSLFGFPFTSDFDFSCIYNGLFAYLFFSICILIFVGFAFISTYSRVRAHWPVFPASFVRLFVRLYFDHKYIGHQCAVYNTLFCRENKTISRLKIGYS